MTNLATLASLTLAASAVADWPAARHDAGRTSATAESLPGGLRLRWARREPAPAPAWPAPARGSYWQKLRRVEPRVVDDRVAHPVIAGGKVLFASSSDDQLRCLDAATGEPLWAFTADGPLRYAPFAADGTAYLGGDDGFVYAVALADGSLKWKRLLAPAGRRIVGNGRVVSAWPVRTGVAVAGGKVYATAGLYPAQGVYAYALNPEDGSIHWRRKIPDSAQGYLLASGKYLFVPTGRGNPVALDRATGKRVKAFAGVGGSYAVVVDAELVAGRGNTGELAVSDVASRKRLVTFPGRCLAATPTDSFLLGKGELTRLDRKARRDPKAAVRWRQSAEADAAVIAAGDRLVLGGDGVVELRSAADGKLIQSWPVEGRALGLAAAAGRLVVTTDRGWVYGFGRGDGRVVKSQSPRRKAVKPTGFALVAGLTDGDVVKKLAGRGLTVVAADRDPATVSRLRRRFQKSGLYGRRVSVVRVSGGLPFADHLFNEVASEAPEAPWPRDGLRRVTRPAGGRLTLNGETEVRPNLEGAGSWTHQFADPANTANSGDRHVGRDLKLQWFGGPGPGRMVDRHLRAPAPLSADGRLFTPAENGMIAVDAYNGTELWRLDLPRSQRYSMPFDAGYMSLHENRLAVAVRGACWLIDAATGRVREKLAVPRPGGVGGDLHWGYVADTAGGLFGSAQLASASRTTPSRDLVGADYKSGRPLVTGRGVFRMAGGRAHWLHTANAIINPSITVTAGAVLFVESQLPPEKNPTGRAPLSSLLADASLVKLDAATGRALWRRPLGPEMSACRNVIYTQSDGKTLYVSGSFIEDRDSAYRVEAVDLKTGKLRWRAGYAKGRPGASGHGEQVHHPVILGEALVAEPAVLDRATGERLDATGAGKKDWAVRRPGHSCGTMSGAGSCVFFRAGNPTLMDFADETGGRGKAYKLSPTRPGCWINIIPAGGLVLIPEASASCVCHYSLQTSMAFAPSDGPTPTLPDTAPR